MISTSPRGGSADLSNGGAVLIVVIDLKLKTNPSPPTNKNEAES